MGRRGAPTLTAGTAQPSDFRVNAWNPNRMDARTYATLTHDIGEFGFLDPLTVRPDPLEKTRFEIIDGENRWRVARDLGLPSVPFMDVGPISDATAKKLTVIFNELRGQYDPRSMADLLNDLLQGETPAQLLATLPFTEEALAGLVGLKDFDWQGLDKPTPQPQHADTPVKWVERTFRMPPDADAVLQQAFAKVREHDKVEDWQALELIAGEFLGT